MLVVCHILGWENMNKQLLSIIFIAFLFLAVVVPQISYCQTVTPKATQATPKSTIEPTPTEKAKQGSATPLLLIGGIIAAIVVAVGAASAFIVVKRRVNEKSLRGFSSTGFQAWVIKRFNGKPSDPSSGLMGLTKAASHF
jgi:hypothetical protein